MSQRLDVRAVRWGRHRRIAIHQTNQQEAQNRMVGASTVQSVCPYNTRGILAEMRHRVHVAASLVRWTVR